VSCPQCVQSQKAGWRKRHPGAPVPIGRPARAARRVSAAAPSHVKHGQFAVGNAAQRRERPAPAQVMGRRRLIQWEARLPRIIHNRLRSCTGCAMDPMDNPRPVVPRRCCVVRRRARQHRQCKLLWQGAGTRLLPRRCQPHVNPPGAASLGRHGVPPHGDCRGDEAEHQPAHPEPDTRQHGARYSFACEQVHGSQFAVSCDQNHPPHRLPRVHRSHQVRMG